MASQITTTPDMKTKTNGQYRDQLKDHVEGSFKAASDVATGFGIDEKMESLRETASAATEKVREYAHESESYLKAHPYQTLAVGALLGMAVGTWLRRSK